MFQQIKKTPRILINFRVESGMGKNERNLAGPVLDYDVAILANGSGLLRESLGRSGVGLGVEVVLLVGHRCYVVLLLFDSLCLRRSSLCLVSEDDEVVASAIIFQTFQRHRFRIGRDEIVAVGLAPSRIPIAVSNCFFHAWCFVLFSLFSFFFFFLRKEREIKGNK